MIRQLKRTFTIFAVTAFTFVGFTQTVQAAMIATDQVAAASPRGDQDRARLASLVDRPELQAQLESLGIDKAQAKERIAALSDSEADTLAKRMDKLPAGGDGIIGALLLIFFVLLITDVLGFTKVFPFTRSIR